MIHLSTTHQGSTRMTINTSTTAIRRGFFRLIIFDYSTREP